MKKIFQKIHLYLGLLSGLIITITCLTGAILVFEEEIKETLYPHRYFVSENSTRVSIETMVNNLKKIEKEAKVTTIRIPSEQNKSISIRYEEGINSEAFVNPYSGEVLETYSYKKTFFYNVFALHRWLMAGDIGKFIVGTSTLCFLFILGSGIIIWWKPQKKILQQRIKLKFSNNWKLMNYDFHVVSGFYTSLFLFIFAFTGLAWSFEWFNNGIYVVTNSPNKKIESPKSKVLEGNTTSIDLIYDNGKKLRPDAKLFVIDIPEEKDDSYRVSTLNNNSLHGSAYDYSYFEQYNGALISTLDFSERNLGQRVRGSFKPVHTGSIFGLPTKIIAFAACLFGVFFPITGFIIWFNKAKKKIVANKNKKPQPEKSVV